MPKLCILYAYDHRRHVVIRRQVQTFLDASFEVSVVDQSDSPAEDPRYQHVRLRQLRWSLFVNNTWRVLRRIPLDPLHANFWRSVLWLRTVSNVALMAFVAWRQNPDFYVAEDLRSAWSALLASKLHCRPVLYCAHELESEQGDQNQVRRSFLRALERRVVPWVDHLIVPNRSRAEVYMERYGLRRWPTVVLNCPVTVPVCRSNTLREILGLDASVRLVLYHGGFVPFRSLDQLVRSVVYFDQNIVLVLMGEQGDYFREVLAPLLDVEGLRDHVFVIRAVPYDEVAPYVASADLGVVIYENVNLNNYLCAPLKLYEYIMMQVPVVACDFPEITQLFQEHPVGITFDRPDPLSIAQAVNAYFRKSEVERAKTREALSRARQFFNWEREGQKWLDILRDSNPRATASVRRVHANG